MLAEGSTQYATLVSTFALLGVVYGSLSTIRQIDLKRIIAYSSVAHMNLVMLGLFSYNVQGVQGAIYLMIGHGVVSTALFFCVGVLYDRYHSRLLRYYGGLVSVMPVFSGSFFAFTLANMSFPGTSNFLGELLLFVGVFAKNPLALLLSSLSIVLGAIYSVKLFNRVVFGTLKTRYIRRFSDLIPREFAILFALILPMVVLGVSANFILDFLHLPVVSLNTVSCMTFVLSFSRTPPPHCCRLTASSRNHGQFPPRCYFSLFFFL
jgi:NADH-ubiquinone oxidoreductase chain 4